MRSLSRYAGALLLVAACTAAAALMQGRFAPANLTMVYLLGVVIAAVACGRGPAMLAAVLSVATFDWVFVPPRWTFEVEDTQYLVTFAVLLVVGLLVGTLTARLREELRRSRARERRTAALYGLSRELAVRGDAEEMLAVAVERIAEVLEARIAVLQAAGPELRVAAGESALMSDPEARAAAQRALENGQIAGLEQWNDAPWLLHLPLDAGMHVHGVISAKLNDGPWDPERLQLFRALASQTALALERCRLARETEVERARAVVLTMLAHDLRTPLTTMMGMASLFEEEPPQSTPEMRRTLGKLLLQQVEHLVRLSTNVLDLARFESGSSWVRKEWQSVEEIVGAVLSRAEPRLVGREVRSHIPDDVPLVLLDEVLFGEVVANLVDNALKHTPPGTPIDIDARVEDGRLRVEVADRGPGIRPGDEERCFGRDYPGMKTHPTWSGHGLAICRAIVTAHDGTIRAAARPGGGASFIVSVPAGEAPPVVEEEVVAT